MRRSHRDDSAKSGGATNVLTIVTGMTQVIAGIFTHALFFLPYPELTFFGSMTPLQLVPQIPIKTKDNQSMTKPLFLVTCISIDAALHV